MELPSIQRNTNITGICSACGKRSKGYGDIRLKLRKENLTVNYIYDLQLEKTGVWARWNLCTLRDIKSSTMQPSGHYEMPILTGRFPIAGRRIPSPLPGISFTTSTTRT